MRILIKNKPPIKIWANNLKKRDREKLERLMIVLLTRKDLKCRCDWYRKSIDIENNDFHLRIFQEPKTKKVVIHFAWNVLIKRFSRIGKKTTNSGFWGFFPGYVKFVCFKKLSGAAECLLAIRLPYVFKLYKRITGRRAPCC